MKIDAYVMGSEQTGFSVTFTADGEEFDHAEDFDSESEALDVARRGVYGKGTVYV